MKNYISPEAEVLFGLEELYCNGLSLLLGDTSDTGMDQVLLPDDPFGNEE